MTVAELRVLLESLGPDWDDREVTIMSGYSGLCHVGKMELERRRPRREQFGHLRDERLERKLRIEGHTNWQMVPPHWTLEGPWPSSVADLGIDLGGAG